MRKYYSLSLAIAMLAMLVTAVPAMALNVQHFRPSTGGTKGFQLSTSDNLKQGQFGLGFIGSYAHNPLTLRISGVPDQHVVDELAMVDFLVDVAFFDWWSAHLDMPLSIYESIQTTTPPVAPASDTGGKAGDLALKFKFQIFDAEETSTGLGLALVPEMRFPTGTNNKFLGDETVNGQIMAVGDWQIHSNRFYMNAGYRIRDRENIGPNFLIVDDELLYGLGFQRPLVKSWDLDIIIEGYGSTAFAENPRDVHRVPVEVLGLFRKPWLENRSLVMQVGGGAGVTDGYGNPTWRIFGGLAYVRPVPEEKPPEPAPVKKIEITQKIHFEFDKAVIRPTSYKILDSVVAVMQSNPDIRHVSVEGHTDAVGSDQYNQSLSERRSQAVVEYLVSKGVDRNRLSSKGFGESIPIDSNDTAEGRANNRRTEFVITDYAQ